MKFLNTLVVLYGLIVVLVMPALHLLSYFSEFRFISFKDYVIAFLLFLLLLSYTNKKEKTVRGSDSKFNG